jgi:hypothetical protein
MEILTLILFWIDDGGNSEFSARQKLYRGFYADERG